jgi:hypothetical protein
MENRLDGVKSSSYESFHISNCSLHIFLVLKNQRFNLFKLLREFWNFKG